jgi:hypothetical protein
MKKIPFNEFERLHQKNTLTWLRRVKSAYEEAITEVLIGIENINFRGDVFKVADFPKLKGKIDNAVKRLQPRVYGLTVNGIKSSWELSNLKNDQFVDVRLANRNPNKKVREILFDPNEKGLQSFIKRKERGLNLSDRVWKHVEPFKVELEAGLGLGISEGKGAREMAKDMKKYLNDPDRLFRRVRDAEGKLQLSKAAKEYNPGQGVYRSSFKNALRLTRTENNIAYRTADHERWQNLPFVTGIEVKLSAAHPKFDICDPLAAEYPKDFKFTGWHPQCICYAVPKMMNDEEYDKLEDAILFGDGEVEASNQVEKLPASFTKYMKENGDRIAGYKNEPYFIRDNPQYVDELKGTRVQRMSTLGDGSKQGLQQIESSFEGTKGFVSSGRRIGDQFTDVDTNLVDEFKIAMDAIDSVHGDGDLTNIRFKRVKSVAHDGGFRTSGNKALQIEISETAGEFKATTLIHEMGHLLDFDSIGKGSFLSDFITPKSSSYVNPLKDVMDAIRDSEGSRKMKDGLKRKKVMGMFKEQPMDKKLIEHYKYLTDDKEQFARAYAQFVAKRSGSPALKQRIDKDFITERGHGLNPQWSDTDFIKIEKALEEFMIKSGWMKKN